MVEKEFVVPNRLGLHARPAALFVNEAARFRSTITVNKDGLEINGKSVMGLMLLAAEHGSRLKVKADGEDEVAAMEALGAIFARKFDED
ncbi:MAG: HPr family phosphocarrier protein [Elusimicrobia bacterium]|nr:HPr family phosphocarrier protein [Elusimicrobiota bacterium]MDE2236296.1 HPr family phosphocarrier protein [Elusimicrobiota bacterium]MDE2424409.1 HPr family phosphocarrier protein [Elusimicrobiota bacterium]